MKIAIVTLIGNSNNGNRLQNYALQQSIKKVFPQAEVETINLDEKKGFIQKSVRFAKSIIKRILNKNILKQKNFKSFDKNITFTKRKYHETNDFSAIANDYDYVITGSDQVWNLAYLKNEKYYFLNFVTSEKKLSYAASVGNNNLTPKQQAIFKSLLKDYKIISVREKQSEKMLKNLGFENVVTSIDPTFLLTQDEWKKVEKQPKYEFKKDYLFVCMLGEITEEYKNSINFIAKQHNLEIVDLHDHKNKIIQNSGPSEFIYLIKHAKLVIADSFHAIVFSIINKTPFLHFTRQDTGAHTNINSRIQNLERIFNTTFPTEKDLNSEDLFKFKIENTEQIIEEERQKSYEYLQSAMSVQNPTNLDDKKFNCTGCGLCANVCPTKAIEIVTNNKGFYQYKINKEKCINCGLCLKMCPANKKYQKTDFNKSKIYGAKNEKPLKDNSSSAGVFGKIATNILNNNGVVYGLSYNVENTFSRITTINDLEKIKGSKYYQANLSTSYPQIEEDLKNNKTVLICATPCQIAGLKQKFFNYENLITIGVVCHGTPSKDTLDKFCVEKYGEIPNHINFRKKTPYWENYQLEFHFLNKTICEERDNVSWFNHFIKDTLLNNCCYKCNFAGKKFGADIVLGDFWGISKIDKKFYDPYGTSICICVTKKGQGLFEQIKENVITKEFKNINKITKYNPCIAKTDYGVDKEYNQELFYINDQKGLTFEENIKEIEKVSPVEKRSFIKRVLRKIKRILFK